MNKKLGCLKHKVDLRDYIAESMLPTAVILPKRVDLRPYLPPVFDQKDQGACSAVASGTQKECLEYFDYGFKGRMSYQFIYNLRSNKSEGMYPRETMKILVEKGCVEEELFPYLKSLKKPNKTILKRGENHKNKSYAEVHTAEGAKKSLYQSLKGVGSAIYVAFPVYNYGPKFWFKREGDVKTGGHAVIIVGYDDKRQSFLLRNSWGEDWVDDGYTWISYSDFENRKDVAYSVLDENSKELSKMDKFNLFMAKVKNWFKDNTYAWVVPLTVVCFSVLGLIGYLSLKN